MNHPLRIAYLCSEFPPDSHGGIGILLSELTRGLARRGHKVHVLGFSPSPRDVEEDGVHVRMLPSIAGDESPRFALVSSRWQLARAARELVAEFKIDLVEAADFKGESALLPFPFGFPVPVIVRYHGSGVVYARMRGRAASWLTRWLEDRAVRSADYRVAVSATIEKLTRESFPGLAEADAVIPNFTDPELMRPVEGVERDANLLAFVGKISISKGLPELFAALPALLAKCPNLRVELAGPDTQDGPGGTSFREYLLRTVDAGCRERVRFLGFVPNRELPWLYSRAGAAVFPSVAEAFGIVGLEAMACECPVIVPRGSCFTEFVRDGETGLHADFAVPEEAAAAVARVLEDRALAERLGRQGRAEVVAKYSLEAMAPRNEGFYRECLRPR